MSAIKAVLFDLDGTLIDSAPLVGGILNEMRLESGREPHPLENYRTWISLGGPELVTRSLGGVSDDVTCLLTEFRRRYRDRPTPEDLLFAGAAWTIRELASHGIKLGICSNKPESLCRKALSETQLMKFFDVVVGGDTVAKSKPDPEPLEFALRQLAVGGDSVVLIGDSLVDQKASSAAGVPFIFFSGGYDDGVDIGLASVVVSDLRQLLDIVVSSY